MSVISALSVSRRPAIGFVAVGLFWGTFAAYLPETKARLGVNDAMMGLLLLGNAVGLITAMWIAPQFDRWLGARSLQIAAVLFGASFVLPGLADTPAVFVCFMVLLGTASGLCDVLMNARVGDLESALNRPLMNANHGVFSVAYALAAIVTGFSREAGVPSSVVLAGWGILVIASASALWIEVAEAEAEDPAAPKSGYPYGTVLLCGSIVLIAFMSEATVETWSALHIERTLNGGAAEGALGPATLGLTMAIGRFSGQALTERFSDYTIIFWAALMASAGVALAALAPTPFWAYLGFGVFGLGVSVVGPLGLAIVARLVPARLRTDAISKAAVMGFSGFFIAPVIMGSISEFFGLRWAYLCVAVFVLVLFPLTRVVRQREAQKS